MQTYMKMRPNREYNAEIIQIVQLPDKNLKKYYFEYDTEYRRKDEKVKISTENSIL